MELCLFGVSNFFSPYRNDSTTIPCTLRTTLVSSIHCRKSDTIYVSVVTYNVNPHITPSAPLCSQAITLRHKVPLSRGKDARAIWKTTIVLDFFGLSVRGIDFGGPISRSLLTLVSQHGPSSSLQGKEY